MKSETFGNICSKHELNSYKQMDYGVKNCYKYVSISEENKELYIYDFTDANEAMFNDLIFDIDINNKNVYVFRDIEQEEKIRNKYKELSAIDAWTYYDDNAKIIMKTYGLEESFLDYDKHYVYNICVNELLKLYDKIKYKIFDYNVRSYLGNSKDSDLKARFKEYLYNYLKSRSSNLIDDDYFKNTNKNSKYQPELFWLCHNGITICSDNFNIKYKNIIFSPANTYILNGAQTLSVFSSIRDDFKNKFKDDEIISGFFEKIIIKVIILMESNLKNVELYSIGLNTQKPINDYTILAASRDANYINQKLSNFCIVKDGDTSSDKTKFTALTFVKTMFIIDQKPEKAKNYAASSNIRTDFEAFADLIKEDKIPDLERKLKICESAKSFFKKHYSTVDKDSLSENEKAIASYASNYFQSYCIKQDIDSVNDEKFENFVNAINDYCEKENKILGINDFKNHSDSLYKKIFD